MKTILSIGTILFLSLFACAQVQDAWVKSGIGYIQTSSENAALVLDQNENVYTAVNCATFNFDDDVPGLVQTFRIHKFKSDGTKIFDMLEEVAVFHKRLVGMAVDIAGNIYCGVYEWRVIDPVIPRIAGLFAVYKYNANGTVAWKRSYGDGENNIAKALALDAAGNVYLTGGCKESGLVQNNPEADYLTVKWNSSGTLQWARRYDGASPGEGQNYANDITVDGSGNVYITGFSQRDGQIGYATIKYNSSGTALWVQRYNGTGSGDDRAEAITLDITGFVYVTGSSEGATATIKYNNDGAELWVQREGAGGSVGRAIKVDGFGSVYVAGTSTIKYRFDGVKLWAKNDLTAYSLALDIGRNVYVAGTANSDGKLIKYNSDGLLLWEKSYDSPLVAGRNSPVKVANNYNVYVISFDSHNRDGNANPYYESSLFKYTQCTISAPISIDVSAESGQCGATVNFEVTTTGDCGDIEYQKQNGELFYTPGQFLDVGHYHLQAVSNTTGEVKKFTIYVNDDQLPVITYCPPGKTVNTDPGVCYATATSVNAGTATATDNCSVTVTGTRSDGESVTANYPVGITTITWTARDASSNTATCSQTITVVDNQPPVISDESAGTSVLSPPDHTMRDIMIHYNATDNCAATASLSVTSNEPVNGTADGDTDPDWVVLDNHHVQLRAERAANGTGRIYTVTITAVDPSGNTSTKSIEIKVPHNIQKPVSGKPFKAGSTVDLEGAFWDIPGNRHTAKWLLDNSTSVKATVTEPSGNQNGKVTGSYKFNNAGVYKLQMNTTDQNGITNYATTNGDVEEIIVIYDPNGGYTYGGGYFNSPAGALTSNPAAKGKASYGFTVNYFKNSTYPKGETQFEFKVGAFEFNALNFDYLVIDNAMAQFKGTGRITGDQSGIDFIMTVVDGQLDGSGLDKIRMKIYSKNTGEVIYDNQPGASDAELPTQAVGVNSEIVIKSSNQKNAAAANAEQVKEADTKPLAGLEVHIYPNPASDVFNISVASNNDKEKIVLQVFDQLGRLVEVKNNVANGSTLRLGDDYRQGVYFIRVIQGRQHQETKIIKLSD